MISDHGREEIIRDKGFDTKFIDYFDSEWKKSVRKLRGKIPKTTVSEVNNPRSARYFFTKEQEKQIADMYNRGIGLSEIAAHFGVIYEKIDYKLAVLRKRGKVGNRKK